MSKTLALLLALIRIHLPRLGVDRLKNREHGKSFLVVFTHSAPVLSLSYFTLQTHLAFVAQHAGHQVGDGDGDGGRGDGEEAEEGAALHPATNGSDRTGSESESQTKTMTKTTTKTKKNRGSTALARGLCLCVVAVRSEKP
jgi:hypothetical protein